MNKEERIYSRYLEGEKVPNFRTLSGIELKEVYTKADLPKEYEEELPGRYPFTRGIHKDMYRARLWTRRQQSGYGTPEESNRRLKYLLGVGQTGLNIDFDIGTKLGLDPDYPLAQGDVGLQGTSLCTFEDMEALYKDIPLDKVSSTLIIQPPYSAVVMAMYLLLAEKRQIKLHDLTGTIMNCPITQLSGPTFHQATTFFPLDMAVKIGVDVMEYCIERVPRWNIVNVNAYNIRETGVNAVQEAAFALALAEDYIKALLARGLDVDKFARRMGFFCAIHIDFFEEIAKIRAMRRIWARILKKKFKARDEKSLWFRTAIQTSALPLTAQQPLNNISRATIQTLAAVLAGCQSIHTTSYDEAYSLPTEEAHKLSLRIQQIIGFETNVVKSVDPLGGSYLIESLTKRLEEEISELMKQIEGKGGFIQCFKEGWVEDQINRARYQMAEQIEKGDRLIVGVNTFREEEEKININIFRHETDMQHNRINYVTHYKKNRQQASVLKSLDDLYQTAKNQPDRNLFPAIIDCVRASATMQEICDALRKSQNFTIPG